ncbi:MAG: DUF4330 domain-containing protein [Maledivibacter sp.]|nr:DUF4330 domain-containing protein [Maledivibacter sp.]
MKIIDNKGRIFGLINYLDLMVLIIVALLVGKFFILDNDENSRELLNAQSNKEILLTYNIKGVKEVSIDSVKEGDVFRDVATKTVLGQVVKKEVVNSQIQTTDGDGKVIYSTVPDRYDLMITLKSMGNVIETDSDIKLSNVNIKIGLSMLIESKQIRYMGVIYGIE